MITAPPMNYMKAVYFRCRKDCGLIEGSQRGKDCSLVVEVQGPSFTTQIVCVGVGTT
jgi:hypothetical protein